MLIILWFCFACAELEARAENVPRPASARETPARTMNRPIKTRKLKKADREADFLFMNNYNVRSVVVAEPPLAPSTLFPVLWCTALGFIGRANAWQAFFQFFELRTARIPENAQPGPFDPGCAGELSTIDYLLSANVTAEAPVWDAAAVSEPVLESECA